MQARYKPIISLLEDIFKSVMERVGRKKDFSEIRFVHESSKSWRKRRTIVDGGKQPELEVANIV